MIAVDSSVIIDYLQGISSCYTEYLQELLSRREIAIPLVVVTELFSSPKHGNKLAIFLGEIKTLEIDDEYWERTGKSRARLKVKNRTAKTADALIAQSCIDHDIALLTRDPGFEAYEEYCGLKLAMRPKIN